MRIKSLFSQLALAGIIAGGLIGMSEAGPDGMPPAVLVPVFDESSEDPTVLGALRQRRLVLEAREEALEVRALELRVVEERINQRMSDLRALAEDVKALLAQRDAARSTRLKQLARTYEAMRPAEAASLMDQLDASQRFQIAQQMRQAKLGPVLARMAPDHARQLTQAMIESRPVSKRGS